MSTGVIEEIKSKLDIVQVLSEYLQVKKAGTRYVALCPFHNEKTPSFSISPTNQFWYCFGCNEGGDVFDFVMRMEGLEFGEAKRALAKKAGVPLKDDDEKEDAKRRRLVEANTLAAKFYHEILLKSPSAEAARAYVRGRALAEITVDDFLIGYAPEAWDTLVQFLGKRGYRDQEMFDAGLVSKGERGGVFDRFRGRLMFPIRNASGDVVAFTGRIMPGPDGTEPKDTGKYVNTQQTPIYNKSAVLFCFDKAKSEIRKKGFAVVVEGNMDAISSHQAGVKNVVASSGTALTVEQLAILKRAAEKLVLSFDNDPAGEHAARRGIDLAVAAGFAVRVLRLPPEAGKDPDDCIRKNPAMWTKAIADAVPFMQWYIDLAKARTDFSNPDSVRAASQSLLAEVAKLPAPSERAYWIHDLSELFHTPESLLFEEVQRQAKATAVPRTPGAPVRPAPPAVHTRQISRDLIVSEHLLAIIFSWPELAEAAINAALPEHLHEGVRDLYKEFILHYTDQRNGGHSSLTFRQSSTRAGNRESADRAAYLELLAEKEFGDLDADARRDVLARLIGEIQKLHRSRRQRDLKDAMARAEKAGDQAGIRDIQEQSSEFIG